MRRKIKTILKKATATICLALIWGMGPTTLSVGIIKNAKTAGLDDLEARLAPTYKQQMIDFHKSLNEGPWWTVGVKMVRENIEECSDRITKLSKAESDPTVGDKELEIYKSKTRDKNIAKKCFVAGGLITLFSGLYTVASPTSKDLCKYIKEKEL